MGPTYEKQLEEEVKTWCIADPKKRAEKMQRERIRHYKLVKDLLLDKLNTGEMHVLEIGGGPEPISDLIPFRYRLVVDPCTDAYSEFFPVPDHINDTGEAWLHDLAEDAFHLAIATNSLDHVREPVAVLSNMDKALAPGGFMAIMCAENNAITNPHPCHSINLTAKDIHRVLDQGYETVWELTYEKDGYRYGWREFEGRIGQPAFAILLRKVYGYG